MASVLYRRLFEIRILHDYYLTADNTSYFSAALSDQDRINILRKKMNQRHLNMAKDFEIKPNEISRIKLQNQRIKFTQTAIGLLAVIEVKQETLGDGTIVYKPVIPIAKDLKFTFEVRIKNPIFSNFTIGRMRPRFPSIYYFTNLNKDGNKSFPSLSQPVNPYSNDITYEIGEVADFGINQREAVLETSSNNPLHWRVIDGSGFVSESDRILLPRTFAYHFSTSSGVSSADFTLADQDDNEVKTVSITSASGLKKVPLNFEEDDAKNEITSGIYTLKVSGGFSYTDQKKIFLDDDLYDPSIYAIYDITPVASDVNFQLIASDGYIIHRKPPVANEVPYPVFETRLRCRITYWRYQSDVQFVGPVPDHLEVGASNKILKGKYPKGLTLTPTMFSQPPDPPALYPNPKPSPLKYESDGKIYSDVYINKLNRLTIN